MNDEEYEKIMKQVCEIIEESNCKYTHKLRIARGMSNIRLRGYIACLYLDFQITEEEYDRIQNLLDSENE